MENSFPHLFAYWAIYSNSKSCIKLENPTKIEEEIETKQKNPNQSNILCVTQEIYDSMAKFSKNLNFLNQSLNNSNIQSI